MLLTAMGYDSAVEGFTGSNWTVNVARRAIENGLTVLGADQYAPGKFVGHSMAFQPDGTALGELGEEQDLLIVKIN